MDTMSGKMFNCLRLCFLVASLAALGGCYQIHSDDDLRTIPVTNNPNVVPQQGQTAQGSSKMPNAMPY